jgi:hypothetical protein
VKEENAMPEISRFLGIKIFMFFNEHNPPHFHVEYNEYKASIDITTFGVLEGKLPSKVLGLVVEWAEDHQNELLENWNHIKETGEWHKIEPLV